MKQFLSLLGLSMLSNLFLLAVLNLGDKGEANADTKTKEPETKEGEKGKTFSQEDVNRFLAQERRSIESKFGDVDAIKNKLREYEEKDSAIKQKELEETRKYDEAKKTYESKISEYQKLINEKDSMLQDRDINFALSNEISKQGGYLEESIALVKKDAILKDGAIRIKAKDSNNLDIELTLEDGIKRFLEKKPYLVKANFKPGSGSPGGSSNIEHSTAMQKDLMTLNNDFLMAKNAGDYKKMKEIKGLMETQIKLEKVKLSV